MTALKIPDGRLEEWLGTLKPYQREQIDILLAGNDPETAAQLWVTTIGHANIAQFGGSSDPKPFWNLLKAEVYDFICSDDAYADTKKKLTEQGTLTHAIIVSSISSAIGAKIGMAAALIVPAIALMFFLIGQMSINAYCKLPRPSG